jgi:hypothetical protein
MKAYETDKKHAKKASAKKGEHLPYLRRVRRNALYLEDHKIWQEVFATK